MSNEIKTDKETKHIHEIEIDGKRIVYDVCSSSSLEIAKVHYNENTGWKYLGTGRIWYVDGFQNTSSNDMHCFQKIRKLA